MNNPDDIPKNWDWYCKKCGTKLARTTEALKVGEYDYVDKLYWYGPKLEVGQLIKCFNCNSAILPRKDYFRKGA